MSGFLQKKLSLRKTVLESTHKTTKGNGMKFIYLAKILSAEKSPTGEIYERIYIYNVNQIASCNFHPYEKIFSIELKGGEYHSGTILEDFHILELSDFLCGVCEFNVKRISLFEF